MARWDRLRRGAKNALVLWRQGRLGERYQAPFEVVWEDPRVRLRHYSERSAAERGLKSDASRQASGRNNSSAGQGRAVLLVPPLMVTSEIYDISPELSAVAWLAGQGADVWVADFGAPDDHPGGVERTLDDHVLAVSACIDRIRERNGHDVHLVGYSQGGMFCYQTAAYRKGEGLASVVAFGAPIDLHRNAPLELHESIVDQVVGLWRRVIDKPLDDLRALPGTLSSLAFKLVAPGQELRHLIQLLGLLPDRERYLAVEPKRKFLGGEGFIAWPGPALRTFIDDFVVANRMKQGGFVIAGKTVALADIQVPILAFVGEQDDFAQPEAVRAIVQAAPLAPVSIVHVAAGHFGLVVGSVAMKRSWPTVHAWTRWLDRGGHEGERPVILDEPHAERAPDTSWDRVWSWLGRVGAGLGEAVDTARQLPRVAELLSLGPNDRTSFAQLLAERAQRVPDQVFFVWEGRAYTYAEADRRVDEVARALPDDEARRHHPDHLARLGALSRLGAVTHDPSWLRGALSAAIAARLSARDTVYCALDLDDPLALEAAIGGALIGGARLAIAARLDADSDTFWREVRNVGATVLVADEALMRRLIAAPPDDHDRDHPLDYVLVQALDPALTEAIEARFGCQVVALARNSAENQS